VVGVGEVRVVSDPAPEVDERHPADVVTSMIEHVLDLASTWPAWSGIPLVTEIEGEAPRIYTPHKAIRRVADHLLDHLSEIEARIAGRQTEPDTWHASAITSAADLALFTQEDLDEAISRLRRLSLIWDVRVRALPANELDAPRDTAWTVRQVAFHVAESGFYADAVGRL
jgi:hypothetical protein